MYIYICIYIYAHLYTVNGRPNRLCTQLLYLLTSFNGNRKISSFDLYKHIVLTCYNAGFKE